MLRNTTGELRRTAAPPVFKLGALLMGIAALFGPIHAAAQQHGVLVGTVVDIGSGSKTVAVKTADGVEHSLAVAGHTFVHGSKDAAQGTVDGYHGLKKGSKVVVHYTSEGGKETADEVGRIGEDGLKASKVTVTYLDSAATTVSVKTENGAKETYHVTSRAGEEIGKGVAKGTEDAAKGTIYFTEKSGQKVVHFFERAK